MSSAAAAPRPNVIEGRIGRKTSNGLTMAFQSGPDAPAGSAVQSGGDGKAAKLGILLGFKNGGPGIHSLTYPDGRRIFVHSREQKPTLITESDRQPIASVNRVAKGGATFSTAVDVNGATVLLFTSDPTHPVTPELFSISIADAAGSDLGRLQVIRKPDGWKTVSDVLDSAWTTYLWWDQAGQSLPVQILGTRLILLRDLGNLERDVLLAACVDLAIGMRPYIPEMN